MPIADLDRPRPAASGVVSRRTARAVRALRGVAAASVTTVVAATAHTLAGGGPPPPALVAVVILLAAPVAVALAGRRLALWRLALTVLASQLLFHASFAIASGATGEPPSGHTHHVVDPTWLTTGTAHAVWPPDPLMIAGHVAAALVTVSALHRGERMLRTLARGVRRLLRPSFETPGPAARRRLAPVAIVVGAARSSILSSDQPRRGPPQAALAH